MRTPLLVLGVSLLAVGAVHAQASPVRIVHGQDAMEVEVVAPNIVRVHFEPGSKTTPRTLVMDPAFHPAPVPVRDQKDGDDERLISAEMGVVIHASGPSVEVQNPSGKTLVRMRIETGGRGRGGVVFEHDANEYLYGVHGLDLQDDDAGILRQSGGAVAAGVQGNAGGPFLFSRTFGLLIDSDGGSFQTRDETIRFRGGSRADSECFLIVGPPLKTMAGLALLTGRPPMPPKWTLGFLNSQWGSNEKEWRDITATYARKGIPVSGYIFDFDWKAWGEDDFGEWRWNSTPVAGNSGADKFPEGASGKFAAEMAEQGIHLAGILKPRILTANADGTPTQAAKYATAHNLWYPNEERGNDYFTHRPAANLDFSNPETRRWYWENLLPAFRAGMAGWWNDEADRDNKNVFGNFQFMNMARALYEGQRAVSNERAWSINRNYYIGAARYSYAEWSGDIGTGFQTMAYQRRRMIATLDLGESAWSMDTGGFNGHPTSENYARWMEFAAFVPVFRVHGGNNEKRQPWVYGPQAEAAAKKAMRLRYDLMPYLYSNIRLAHETGVGLVRPLFWEFPADDLCATDANEWMFGDALLVSPIVELGAAAHRIYLPEGTWLDYATGQRLAGGKQITVSTAADWQDIPLYIRDGSIIASQPQSQGNELSPNGPLVLDVYPSASRAAQFVAYDDDGHSYAYEKGEFFRQQVSATQRGKSVEIALASATGSYAPHFPTYLLRIHAAGVKVAIDGAAIGRERWLSATDRFGAVTEVSVPVTAKGATVLLSTN